MYPVSFGVNRYAQSARAMTPKFGMTTTIVDWDRWLQGKTSIVDDAAYGRMRAKLADDFAEQLDDRYSRDQERIVAATNLLEDVGQRMLSTTGRAREFYGELHRVVLSELAYRTVLNAQSPIPPEVSLENKMLILRHLVKLDDFLKTLNPAQTLRGVYPGRADVDLRRIGSLPFSVQRIRTQIDSVLTQNRDVFIALLKLEDTRA